jgi:small ligand-binding sensory domain FIST
MESSLGLPETVSWVETLAIAGFARELPEELNEDYGSKYILFGCLGRNEDDSIITAVTCHNGMKIKLTRRDEKKMFEGVDSMVKKTLDKLNGKKPVAVFHTDCSLRGRFSLNRILKDELINRIQSPICRGEDVPWLGWYSGGEFGMIGGQSWIHNFSSSLSIVYR